MVNQQLILRLKKIQTKNWYEKGIFMIRFAAGLTVQRSGVKYPLCLYDIRKQNGEKI